MLMLMIMPHITSVCGMYFPLTYLSISGGAQPAGSSVIPASRELRSRPSKLPWLAELRHRNVAKLASTRLGPAHRQCQKCRLPGAGRPAGRPAGLQSVVERSQQARLPLGVGRAHTGRDDRSVSVGGTHRPRGNGIRRSYRRSRSPPAGFWLHGAVLPAVTRRPVVRQPAVPFRSTGRTAAAAGHRCTVGRRRRRDSQLMSADWSSCWC